MCEKLTQEDMLALILCVSQRGKKCGEQVAGIAGAWPALLVYIVNVPEILGSSIKLMNDI